MDIQTEKLHLIEQLTRLQDAEIIGQIKSLLENRVAGTEPNGKVITASDLIARAEASNRAIEADEITEIEDLEEESKSW